MYICICNAVTDREITAAVERGACTLRELREELGVSACCGRCKHSARRCLNQVLAEQLRSEPDAA